MSVTAESQTESKLGSLQPILAARFALSWPQALACSCFAIFFGYLNYLPLFYSDIWGHVLYGNWILAHHALPTTDPFMPLSEGMRVVDTGWLAQLIFALTERWGGAAFLSNLFAVVVCGTYLVQARVFYLISGRVGLTLVGVAFSFFVGFSRHAIIRPEIFGALCFSILLWLCVRADPWRSRTARLAARPAQTFPIWLWIAIPLLFVFWANSHGSFAMGLAFLACHAAGQVLESGWKSRSLLGVFRDSQVRRWVLLTELALLATLLNPYGLDLLITTAQFGSNPNLREIQEWLPLTLTDTFGIQYGIAAIVLMVVLRHSRQRMRAADVCLLLVFGIAVASATRLMGWLAPVLTLVLMPHATEIGRRLWPVKDLAEAADEERPAPRFALTMVATLIIWCVFALSPISQPILGGKGRKADQLYNRSTPREISKYLRENPPTGLTLGPQWWSDWFVWDGPPELKMAVMTNVHLIPGRVWRDYLRVARGQAGWETLLDRYAVTTLIVHKNDQEDLALACRTSSQWKVVFEDDLGIVLNRRETATE